MKFINCFPFFFAIFAFLDPDPDPDRYTDPGTPLIPDPIRIRIRIHSTENDKIRYWFPEQENHFIFSGNSLRRVYVPWRTEVFLWTVSHLWKQPPLWLLAVPGAFRAASEPDPAAATSVPASAAAEGWRPAGSSGSVRTPACIWRLEGWHCRQQEGSCQLLLPLVQHWGYPWWQAGHHARCQCSSLYLQGLRRESASQAQWQPIGSSPANCAFC